jgi:hypothetical protein
MTSRHVTVLLLPPNVGDHAKLKLITGLQRQSIVTRDFQVRRLIRRTFLPWQVAKGFVLNIEPSLVREVAGTRVILQCLLSLLVSPRLRIISTFNGTKVLIEN